MPSTVIRRFVYDQTAGNLWVEFTTGRKYVYSDVPIEVATPSHEHVKTDRPTPRTHLATGVARIENPDIVTGSAKRRAQTRRLRLTAVAALHKNTHRERPAPGHRSPPPVNQL